MKQEQAVKAPVEPMRIETDRFGNRLDPIVRYARGSILKSSDEEIVRMLRARQIVGERVRKSGKDSVYDLSGMNRGSGITVQDVPHLTSHVPFFAHFEGKTEPLALKHMGADPVRHAALILNRVSAANFIALTTLLERGARVFAFAPTGGQTHPSALRPISMVGADFREFHSYAELAKAWEAGAAPRLEWISVYPGGTSLRRIRCFSAAACPTRPIPSGMRSG